MPSSCEQRLSHGAHRLLLAEIGLAHLGVGADRVRRAGGDDAAIDQHRDAVGEREHRLHVVLDQQDGQLALELAQRPTMRAISSGPMPGHRLVEQQHARLGGERHGELELTCSPWLMLGDDHVGAGGKPDARERGARRLAQRALLARVAPEVEGVAGMRLHRQRHVVERGEIAETAT